MTDYGDKDQADAYDTAPADPFQVAVKLHQLRRREALEDADWDELDDTERNIRIRLVAALIAWGQRGGFFR